MNNSNTGKTSVGWADPSQYLERIFVEKSCQDNPYAMEIMEKADLPVSVVDENGQHQIVPGIYPDNLTEGKKVTFAL